MTSPAPQQSPPQDSIYVLIAQVVNAALLPLSAQLQHIQHQLEGLDSRFYSKETLDQRFKPLEESALSKSQRTWMVVGGVGGIVALLLTMCGLALSVATYAASHLRLN